MSTLKIQNLKFKYKGMSELVLDIPFFNLEKGEKVFLHGPSGSGKSTFLEIISGVLPFSEGDVQVAGTSLSMLSPREKDQHRANHLGYIFQSFNLIPYLTVQENILLPLGLSPQKRTQVSFADQNHILQHLCMSLGIEDLLNKNVMELSIGQQQRVAAARAMIGNPELILADEPTSALDYDHREKFIQLLFEHSKNTKCSLLFVSHDKTLEKLFDRSVDLRELQNQRSQ